LEKIRPNSALKRQKLISKRLSRLDIGLQLELQSSEYAIFVKKFKAHKEKKTVVPILARKMTTTSQMQSIENEEK